jgi:LuxR family transcriptional regulator, maltose regulon positive regulatory protein
MDVIYPSTKFFIPRPRRNIVRRQRLFGRLNESADGKLISVCAPAGYGKTTLVASWLASQERPVAWLSVEESDNDIYRFCLCVLDALRAHQLLAGDQLRQMLHSAAPPSEASLPALLLNELAGLQAECILVVDDYHVISDPAVHDLVHRTIEQAPSELHFLFCSRTGLPFAVSRLRVRSELFELGQQDLGLTLEETGLYMNMIMGVGLKAADVAELHRRTEGWLVGLQLAAISLRDHADPAAFIQNLTGDNRYIADYLVDEVLGQIPADLQDFLLRTSALREMSGPLCDAMLEIDYSQDLLEALDRRRLFIIPLDEIRQSFRYHHLFRDMLFDRLERRSPGLAVTLYQRASAWYSANGSKETAVEYALLAGDFAAVRGLLVEIGPGVLYRGNWTQLLSWYEELPERLFLDAPELWLNYLMTLINAGAILTASRKLDKMEAEDLERKIVSETELAVASGNLAAVRGVLDLHSRADAVQAIGSLAKARERLPRVINIDAIFAEFNYGAACLLAGEYKQGRVSLERSVEWARQENVSLGALIGMSYVAGALALAGELRAAHQLLQAAGRYAHEWGLQEGAVFAKANLELGRIYYEWNQLETAAHYLGEGIRLAEQGGYLDQLLTGYVDFMRVQLLQGDAAGARETVERLRAIVEKYGNPPVGLSVYEAARADLALQLGDLGVANRWADRYQPAPGNPYTVYAEYQQLVLARLLSHRDDNSGMCRVISPMRERAAEQGLRAATIFYDVMEARCLFMGGEPENALGLLESALAAAEPDQFIRTFLDEGGVVISMIKQLLTARKADSSQGSISLEYLHRLLDEAAKDTVKASTGHAPAGGVEGPVALTSQELKVLELLEGGCTNKQISAELSISLNTVKFHLKNIYGKMGVANRTQASRALREKS